MSVGEKTPPPKTKAAEAKPATSAPPAKASTAKTNHMILWILAIGGALVVLLGMFVVTAIVIDIVIYRSNASPTANQAETTPVALTVGHAFTPSALGLNGYYDLHITVSGVKDENDDIRVWKRDPKNGQREVMLPSLAAEHHGKRVFTDVLSPAKMEAIRGKEYEITVENSSGKLLCPKHIIKSP